MKLITNYGFLQMTPPPCRRCGGLLMNKLRTSSSENASDYDMNALFQILPRDIHENLLNKPRHGQLLEVIMDLGRLPEACYLGESSRHYLRDTEIGGVETVILGDQEARTRNRRKTILERKAPPTFPFCVEMRKRHYWVAHRTERSVDLLLQGKKLLVEVRRRDKKFKVVIERWKMED